MPNGYSVVPNILPGNVTVGGTLTVGGDLIRIGAAAPFARVGKSIGGNLILSLNVGPDQSTRDNAGFGGFALLNPSGGIDARQNKINAAGGLNQAADKTVLLTDYTAHAHTGTVTLDQIYVKVIAAHVIGANGGLHMHMSFFVTAQGAVASTLHTRLDSADFHSLALPVAIANKAFMYDIWMRNRNSEAVQEVHSVLHNLTDNTFIGFRTTTALDTTADRVFSVSIANGIVGDNQQFDTVMLELENSFGPV